MKAGVVYPQIVALPLVEFLQRSSPPYAVFFHGSLQPAFILARHLRPELICLFDPGPLRAYTFCIRSVRDNPGLSLGDQRQLRGNARLHCRSPVTIGT
jgi:hypothetical protein